MSESRGSEFTIKSGTEYQGPVVVSTLVLGGQPLRVVRPADPDRLLDDPLVLDWNRRDDYMPYWAYLWPGAYLLAEAVAEGILAPTGNASESLDGIGDRLRSGTGGAGCPGAGAAGSSLPITTPPRWILSHGVRPRTVSIRLAF